MKTKLIRHTFHMWKRTVFTQQDLGEFYVV